MDFETMKKKLDEAQFVLVGIGEEWRADKLSGDIRSAYEKLAGLLEGKDYFVVTTLEDGLIFGTALDGERISAPFAGEQTALGSSEERWREYTQWLMGTLNRTLFILELGEGFGNPSVIRWPFEKTACLNLKAYLCRVHRKFSQLPKDLGGRGQRVSTDSVQWILSEQ